MKRLNRTPSLQRGLSLAELLAALGILAVVMLIAVPGIASMGNGMKLSAMSNDLMSHLYLARGESIKRHGRVALCKSADGVSCTSTGGWEQGWIVFHDSDNNGVRDAGEPLVARMEALPPGWHLAGNSAVARYISFHPTGTTKLVSGAFQAGTLTLCRESAHATEARQVVLSAVGRPRVQSATVTSCL